MQLLEQAGEHRRVRGVLVRGVEAAGGAREAPQQQAAVGGGEDPVRQQARLQPQHVDRPVRHRHQLPHQRRVLRGPGHGEVAQQLTELVLAQEGAEAGEGGRLVRARRGGARHQGLQLREGHPLSGKGQFRDIMI